MLRPEFVMGLQSATAALFIVTLNATIGLTESAWAITACTYAISGSASATIDRVKRRIFGTASRKRIIRSSRNKPLVPPIAIYAASTLISAR